MLMSDNKNKESSHLDRLINNLIGYVDTQFKLIQLEVKNEVANAVTLLMIVLVLAIIIAFAGLLFSVAFAIYLGGLFDSNVLGFSIIGSIYLISAIGLASQFKKIRAKVSYLINKKIKQLDISKQDKLNP